MPREIIKSVGGPYHVKLGWDHVGSVQIGVELDDSDHKPGEDAPDLLDLLYGSEKSLSELGGVVSVLDFLNEYESDAERGHAILAALRTVNVMPYRGVWADLNRRSINDLIRQLRRARDAAYGKDE